MSNDAASGGRGVEFGILGPLRVTRNGIFVNLGGRQQRAVLALLLIDADRSVPTERIADALWGEQPPAGYTTTIQTYVFHLREALEPDRAKGAPARILVTEKGGYRLDTTGAQVDARIFEAAVTDAQADLHTRHCAQAVATLDAALALWRGEVLADVAELDAVTPVAAGLDEFRLAAIETRVDARLALGQHALLVGELDKLVTAHPLREHLHAQRMLALYWCGRQADALVAYRQLRDVLDRDIGVAPSPPLQRLHQQILNHDPDLAAPIPAMLAAPIPALAAIEQQAANASDADDPAITHTGLHPADAASIPSEDVQADREARGPTAQWRRNRWRVIVPVVVVLAAGTTAAGVVAANTPHSSLRALPGNSVGIINPDGSLHDPISVGAGPSALAYGGGSLWVTSSSADTVTRIDPNNPSLTAPIKVGSDPTAVAVSATDVWVVNSGSGTVSRINLANPNGISQTVTVGNQPDAIAYGPSGLWVANRGDDTIQHINPDDGSPGPAIDVGGGPDGIAVGDGSVWVANGLDGTVSKVNPASQQVQTAVQVGAGPTAIAVVGGSVWVANSLEQSISRIDPASGELAETVRDVGDGPTAITSDGKYVWVAAAYAGTVVRIDPRNLHALHRYRIGASPDALASNGRSVYVAAQPFAAPSHVGGTLTIAQNTLPGSFTGIDPADAYLAFTVVPERLVYDGLVAFRVAGGAAGNTVVPDLANGLPTVSQDGKTYTFTIRAGIRYSTGTEVQAQDFGAGFRRVFTTGGGNPGFFSSVQGASACLSRPATCTLSQGVSADNTARTVTIHLTAPDPDLLDKLAYFVYPVPPGTSPKRLTTPPPGTGPYEIAHVTKKSNPKNVQQVGNKLVPQKDTVFDTLVRNPLFRQWSFAAQPGGYPDVIKFTAVTDAATAAKAIQAGKLDAAPLIGGTVPELQQLVAGLRARYPARVRPQVLSNTDWEALNTRTPPFNDVRVRQAVNYAVDRRRIIDIQDGSYFATATCQLLPPNFPSYVHYCPYTKSGSPVYAGPDLAKALKLVKESGTQGMHVTVYGAVSRPADRAVIDYLASVIAELGYRVTVHAVAASTYAYFGYPYDPRNHVQLPGSAGWNADYPGPANFYDSLFSCSAFAPNSTNANLSEFCNPSLDKLVAGAKNSVRTNPGVARREWTEIDHLITDKAPIVAIDNLVYVYFVSARVGNYQSTTLGPLVDQLWIK